ncbi:YbbR domain-containing protein [Fontibacillus phaseoli]|uniref:YbbR domain-containing protein n=1 Tax=Fontibacillus phaseoli TaxID=1416533 RepID=A0A369B705_9BACL|nr:CdaR family protein [Fontibacillus phaseoli]RCX16398.1 YbbR domain-containing protein [Fontibacillus phaseoli]
MDKWLNQNNFAKVIALIFSIILWAMVHIDSGTPVAPTTVVNSKTIDTKIQVTGFDSDKYVLYDLEPDTVRLEVKGKRTDLTTNFSDYKVKLDLKNIGPGTITLPLAHELPPGVQLISMDPSIIKVTIEAKETKQIPVTIVTKGNPADGMQLGSPIVIGESTVDVTLPQSEIEELQKVQGTVDVTGLNETAKGKTVKLTAYDKHGQEMTNAEISPDSVEVDVPINKLYKNVPLEVRKTGKLPNGYVLSSISTNVEGVAIYGSKESLEGISSYPVTVDLSQFNGTNETRYTVGLTPPEGFEKIEPSSVQVTVKIEPAGQKLIDNIPITLINVNEALTEKFINPEDAKISLSVFGAKEVLDKLKAEDFTVTADLSGLGQGTHTVPVNVKLPEYVESSETGQSLEVQIELTEKGKPATSVPDENPSGTQGTENSSPSGEGTNQSGANEGNGSGSGNGIGNGNGNGNPPDNGG